MEKTKKKNVFSKIVNWLLTIIIILLAVVIGFNILISRVAGGPPVLFGHMFLVVVTDSMEPELMVGDFIVAKYVPIDTVEVGDNAVFVAPSGSSVAGKSIVHKVIDINRAEDGQVFLTTQGMKAGSLPDTPFTTDRYLGVQIWQSRVVGKIVLFLSNWVNLAFVVALIVLLFFTIKIIKYIAKTLKEGKNDAAAQ